jgi:hypothetical protein
MKISFGIIVVNGEPWIEPVLHNLYKHAHSICIAEGATKNWRDTNKFNTPRSTDNTLDIIKKFPDPDNKIRLVTPDTFYDEKLEQCNAWLSQVPEDTDYVWQIDVDEFYHNNDIELIKDLLKTNQYTYVEFPVKNFFKGFDYIAAGGRGWGYDTPFPRIFKYFPGCVWESHRPPTILSKNGTDLRSINPLLGNNNPVSMLHYSYVTDKQVEEKIKYYAKTFNRDYYNEWYLPFYQKWTPENRKKLENQISAHPSVPGGYTKRFNQEHPDVIQKHFNLKNKNTIIRLDDFPTGVRPLLKNIDPLVEILSKFCNHFENVKLGIVPKLLNNQLVDKIKHLNFEPCMHGYDHNYFKFSPILESTGDVFNSKGTVPSFSEFDNCTPEEIYKKIEDGKAILEGYFNQNITTYIPPCNQICYNTKVALKKHGFTTIFTEGNHTDNMFKYVPSDYYGRVIDTKCENHRVLTYHLTWEYDELTWLQKDIERWSLKLEKIKNENIF